MSAIYLNQGRQNLILAYFPFFLPEVFFTCPYDIYIVISWKFPLVHTGDGTTWAIRTIDFATPVNNILSSAY